MVKIVRLLIEKGVFKCHRGTEEEKWKCHCLTSCLRALLQKIEDSFRGKEMEARVSLAEMMILIVGLFCEPPLRENIIIFLLSVYIK